MTIPADFNARRTAFGETPKRLPSWARCRSTAVELGGRREVAIGHSVTTHLHTVAMQDLDDTALAEFIPLSKLRG